MLQRAHLLDNTEKLERSSRRLEAGYQIAVETGAYSVLGLGEEGVRGCWRGGVKIVAGMSERQQIVLLICEVGGCVCLCVFEGGWVGGGGKEGGRKSSLFP